MILFEEEKKEETEKPKEEGHSVEFHLYGPSVHVKANIKPTPPPAENHPIVGDYFHKIWHEMPPHFAPISLKDYHPLPSSHIYIPLSHLLANHSTPKSQPIIKPTSHKNPISLPHFTPKPTPLPHLNPISPPKPLTHHKQTTQQKLTYTPTTQVPIHHYTNQQLSLLKQNPLLPLTNPKVFLNPPIQNQKSISEVKSKMSLPLRNMPVVLPFQNLKTYQASAGASASAGSSEGNNPNTTSFQIVHSNLYGGVSNSTGSPYIIVQPYNEAFSEALSENAVMPNIEPNFALGMPQGSAGLNAYPPEYSNYMPSSLPSTYAGTSGSSGLNETYIVYGLIALAVIVVIVLIALAIKK
ncbi:MAG: hypothetical protein QXI16_03195 [Sulfolobaceae archaeon]